ncbi:MAG: hypothetical protein IKT46_00575 [Clostridia bacterium]|nr:hypothetical protein [Clostridia bacterium]
MKENKFTAWVKSHKTELTIAGGVVLTTVSTILLINNLDKVKSLIQKDVGTISIQASNIDNNVPGSPTAEPNHISKIVDVREHFRKLSEGCHPSPEKLAEAARKGIELMDDQTIVDAHTREYVA